jgi:mono/diheme cytochrome c family protein
MKPKASSLRRRSTAHVVALGFAGLIVAGVAAGCGSGGDKTAVTPTTTTSSTATTTTATGGGQVAAGAQLFSSNCESCHGSLGAGGHVGPNLQKSPVAEHLADVEKQVRHGGGAMPPFSGVLTDQEIDAVAHYVVETIAPKG